MNALRKELAAANLMVRHVSRVLGTCPACWGLNKFCRTCLGNGGPGTHPVDIDALISWITPALECAGLIITRARVASGETD